MNCDIEGKSYSGIFLGCDADNPHMGSIEGCTITGNYIEHQTNNHITVSGYGVTSYGQTWTNKAVLIQGNLFNGMNITPHGVVLRNTEACVVKANQFSAQTTTAINLAQVNKNYDIEPNAYSGYINTLTSPPQQLPPPVNSVAGTAQPACFHTCGE